MNNYTNNCKCRDNDQHHVHEILGSVKLAELREDPHNHRFASVSDQAMRSGNSHVHMIQTRTDFYEDHFHVICVTTGPAVQVGDRHVHFLTGMTNVEECHKHEFIAATMIEDPIGD